VIRRHNLQFPEKDTALRDDVHALGGLVGEVLRDQGGDRLLERVEGDRVAAIGRRGASTAIARVAERYERESGHRPYVFTGSSPGVIAFGTRTLTL